MFQGNYIEGQFFTVSGSEKAGEWALKSPADLSDSIGDVAYSYAAIDRAVESALKAFRSWRRVSLSDRAAALKRYQEQIKRREEQLARQISREVGKPLWESKTEVASMVSKIDISIQHGQKLTSDYEIPNIMGAAQEGVLGACRYRPHGVMAVIGPFNFPGHLPNGHIVPALLAGNTIVFKPSEKTPGVAQLMAEAMHAAGLPAGVFNLVQGEREVGRRLCVHPEVAGVLFTGSYEVGTRIKQDTLLQHWKLLALEMGGKNSTIIHQDADFESAVQETLLSAFLTTGQRCSATSRVLVHESLLERFLESFHARAKAFTIGHWSKPSFMGPLIDAASVDRYTKFLGIASREGCELVMRGKAIETGHAGHYVAPSIAWVPSPSIEQTKKSVFQQSELFAPCAAVLGYRDLDEAVAQANETQFGLVTSVFTGDRKVYDKAREDLEVGLVNWNKSTVGASSRLPFGGFKKSGNHFPTALSASLYCAAPVSSLEVAEPKAPEAQAQAYPGLNWKP